ncbi:C10 family peptidase [Myroides pelagicus]|uniref:C10 family peptidase n=1 Tax=Myroides pelagicus TaxID=270914 RepID=UPI002DB8B6EF|nr:C10 family peptidase [Myroides pelagicus]MEC4114480.1 C10 family peptidase [Myroides pelagicus]
MVEVKPLLATNWGQGQGYNNYSPEINCNGIIKKGYTGCVATAVAQVMRYYKFPTSYNWSIMPNQISDYDTNTQEANEVSKLMRQIGIFVGMEYKCDGSEAKSSAAVNALVKDFGYSSSIKLMDYNPNIVALELENNRPVILDGATGKSEDGFWIFKQTSYSGGHAWVCDGYQEILYKTVYNEGTKYETIKTTSGGKYFHMNWGWDGAGTESKLNNGGWFKYDNFDVKLSNGESLNYKYRKNMIVNIKPSI